MLSHTYARRHAGQSILMAIYGILVNTPDHDYIMNAEALMTAVGQVLRPGGVLVDALPFREFPTRERRDDI